MGEPVNRTNRVLHPHASHVYPLSWGRQPRRVVPVKFLAEVEILRKFYRELQMIGRSLRPTREISSPNLDNKRSCRFQNASEPFHECAKPLYIPICCFVPVFLLLDKREGRGSDDQIDGLCRNFLRE